MNNKKNSLEKKNTSSLKGRFKVDYPKVITEFENAMHKFPVKKILYKAIFRGRGLEFDSYRNFNQGGDASLIDWKASLRSNELMAKKYIEERNLNVYFLIDVGNSMLFGSKDKLKAEYASELIVALSHLIISSGDRVGVIMFNQKISKYLPPSNTKNHFSMISTFLSDPKLYGGGFNLDDAIDISLKRSKSSYSIFIIVSDFIKVSKSSMVRLKLLRSRFDVMAIMIRDPLDEEIPNLPYQFAIQDPYSSRQMILDTSLAKKKYGEFVLAQKNRLIRSFRESQIDFLDLRTDKSFSQPVATFLKSRAKGAERL